ncbi:basic helix-loop-helix domain-containing protein [Aspergillus fischeri NRRL 181]|uniref:HLH transcription factor, putative n=1 Tax=Neosartorya fischeri (strain ATCC 1020 / DSM 3700 / CBS 544.65 / FGSC A1164 / JCM 1740 / NRRL 181 / WB 181) TaxID=331117 RepID=A1CYH0_NEOFI|nr:HLH transcription factor, putative [Aspergillus fischeri NRRL 181]EAW23790.1 HLH transcription factor, putative [Aspergillus fischeri NRRL 181]
MSTPGIGGDFQLFSPLESTRRISQGNSMSVDQTRTDDASQDWTQWMRWDDEQAFPETANASPSSPFDLAFISPSASSGREAPDAMHKDFSPDISLDFKSPSLGSFPGGDLNNNVSPQPDHVGEGPLSVHSNSPLSSIGASRKRKTGSDDDGSAMTSMFKAKQAPSKKRAHNVIEKRYRANLNEKIAELRDSVPSLRASYKQANGNSGDDDDDGVTSASKLNKASILSKATEYIRHLEIRNKRLEEENTALKIRLRQLDKAADQIVTSAASVSSPSDCTVSTESGASSSPSVFSHAEDVPSDHSPTSSHPPEGLIKVPDAWKRMRAAGSNESSYSQSYIQYKKTDSHSSQSGGGRMRSHLPNKYMLGALAGLMVLEGLGTEKKTESTAKGLLAVPLNLLNRVQLPSEVYSSAAFQYFWSSWHARAISHFLLLAILVVGSAFIVFVYLFNSDPRRQYSASKVASDVTLSSCNFRRQAWLTSIQRVGVPRHRFFHEWYVVTSRCFEYVLRCLLGWKLYSLATGVTEEDEKGRVKTWDIAIDAQLAGGDAEISKSRLVLTIFAAGTLPRSPMRMMLKALHCRILMWRVGEPGSWTFNVSNDVARSLARYQWDLARKMNAALPKNHPDALPSHLATLLKIDCDDVMIDTIIQRAANLTWNRPTQEGTDDDEALLDVVEEDPAIQSSLDALAAWWSSHLLQRALLRYFEASSGGPDAKKSRDVFKSKIKLALDVAPQPSAAHTRALVMKAVFFERDRVANIGSVLAALPKDKGKNKQNQASNFLDSSLPISVREEISTAVRCAMIAAIFKARATGDTSLPAAFTVQKAIHWFNRLPLDPVELTLLEFAAVYHLLHILASDIDYLASSDSSAPPSPMSKASDMLSSSEDDDEDGASRRNNNIIPHPMPNLGRVASELIYWARNAYNPAFYGFTSNLVKVIETECTSLCQTAGVHVADYSCVQEEKSKAKQAIDAKRRFAGDSEEASDNPLLSDKS